MKKAILLFLVLNTAAYSQTLKDAQRLNDNEQYETATEVYRKLIAKEPANGNLYYRLGETLLNAGMQDSSLAIFQLGFKAEPSNFINLIGMAKVKLSLGLMAEAKPLIDQALQKSAGKNALILMAAGEAYSQYKAKDLLSAQVYLDNAIKLDPKNPDIYNALGDVYLELNNGTMAITNYNKALSLDKSYTKALLHRGQLYKRATNYEGAATEFEQALAIDSNFATAYRELGEVFYLQKKLDKAKINYKKYLELSKSNNGARLRYASFLFHSKNYPEAMSELNQILPVDSNNIGLIRLSAYINHETNDSIKAKQLIDRLWFITSDTTKRINLDYEYYGKILVKSGNDSLGGLYIWQAYQMDPSKTDMLTELGNIYMKNKRNIEAAKVFEEKISMGKNVTTVDYINLGKSYYFSKENGKADTAFTKVTELQPNYAYGHFWKGRVNSQLDSDGKLGLAKQHFEKFIEIATVDSVSIAKYKKSDLVEAYGNIALVYYQQKNYEQATIYCKKVFELDPENENAKTIMANIKIIKEVKKQ